MPHKVQEGGGAAARTETYDFLVLGTGVKETVLAGLLSQRGKSVLQIDSEKSYGSSTQSLSYSEFLLRVQARGGQTVRRAAWESSALGASFSIDLTPRLFMANEDLVDVIIKSNIAHCIEFGLIGANYFVIGGKKYPVPNSKTSALKSNICNPFQGVKVGLFFREIQKYHEKISSVPPLEESGAALALGLPPTTAALYKKFGISQTVQDVIGHAICLYLDDSYLSRPPAEFIRRVGTYFRSLCAVGKYNKSPFLYPHYGLSEVSQAFARMSSIHGGTVRMGDSLPPSPISPSPRAYFLPLADGTSVFADSVIANASFFPSSPVLHRVLRAVAVLRDPPAAPPSEQVILPCRESGRPSDVFLLRLGPREKVAPPGYSLLYLSTLLLPSEPVPSSLLSSAEALFPASALLEWHFWSEECRMGSFFPYPEVPPDKETFFPLPDTPPAQPSRGVFVLGDLGHGIDFRSVHEEILSVLLRAAPP